MEEQRSVYEDKINELELTLGKYQQMTVKLESTALALKTKLAALDDVKKQLETTLAHLASIDKSKTELQEQLEGASAYIAQLE